MEILKNKNIPINLWNEIMTVNSFASPFQSHEYFTLINSVNGLAALAVAVIDSDRVLALAVITIQKETGIKGFFSRRGIIYGGVLIDPTNPEALNILLTEIDNSLRNRVIYLEIRNFFNYSDYKELFYKNEWEYESYLNIHLKCESQDIIWNNLNRNRKRQIKKATLNGVKIMEPKSVEDVRSFYLILENLYKTKIHKPLFSWDFFMYAFMNLSYCKFFLVKTSQNEIIGGSFCLVFNGEKIYNWYGCGLDKEYPDLSPTVMATYAILEYGVENGFKWFDFMGAGKPNKDYGVRDFKEKFGGTLVENGRFLKVQNAFLYNIGKIGLKVYKFVH